MTMITTTNTGSVYLRLSAYSIATAEPAIAPIAATSTAAQKPNTTSTSPSRWNSPAWRGWRYARRSNTLVESVCSTATANRAVATSSTVRMGRRIVREGS